jgi:hypothetical protein
MHYKNKKAKKCFGEHKRKTPLDSSRESWKRVVEVEQGNKLFLIYLSSG